MCEACCGNTLSRRGFLTLSGLAASAALLAPTAAGANSPPDHISDAVDIGGGYEILPRSTWGSDLPPTGPLDAESSDDVRFLLIHHSASPNGYSPDAAIEYLRTFYMLHTGPDRGWNDIAYNFLVDEHGRIFEGREGSVHQPIRGDATGGSQGFALLCCFIGDHSDQPPTQPAQDSMVALLAWLASRYAIDTTPGATTSFTSRGSNLHPVGTEVSTPTIAGHRSMSLTACPGDAAIPLVETVLPERVSARILAGSTTTVPATTAGPSTTPATTPEPNSTTSPATTAVGLGAADVEGADDAGATAPQLPGGNTQNTGRIVTLPTLAATILAGAVGLAWLRLRAARRRAHERTAASP